MDNALKEKASKIKMLVLDVDGVLTDGGIIIGNDGELAKRFNAQDGLGISSSIRHGMKVAIITGRQSSIVRHRAAELGITEVREKIRDKKRELFMLANSNGLMLEEIAYMGDDLNDMAPLRLAGLALAPANAVTEIREAADYVTSASGGHGAVREALEFIMKARGLWDEIVAEYSAAGQGDAQ